MAHDKIAQATSVRSPPKCAHAASLAVACALSACIQLDELDRASDSAPSLVDAGAPEPAPPPACTPVIDRFKELVIVDPSVLDDPLRSGAGGAWSFGHLIEQMKPEAMTASDFVQLWLEDFKASEVNGFPVAARSGVDAMLASWPKMPDGGLDLERAPFRLIAITNRVDLRDDPQVGGAGEGRLVFAAQENDRPAPFTLIFEYLLPADAGKDAVHWAAQWHALGAIGHGEGFNRVLESITRAFTDRNALPERQNGSALAQVRSNESLFGSPWELREFRLDTSGALRISPMVKCPDQSFNGGEALAAFVRDHAGEVATGTHTLPHEMLGGSCPETPAHVWRLPGVDERLRHAFARETCNGCHSAETATKNGFFHISPFASGAERLSPFLHDPGNPGGDELTHRADELAALLCGKQSE